MFDFAWRMLFGTVESQAIAYVIRDVPAIKRHSVGNGLLVVAVVLLLCLFGEAAFPPLATLRSYCDEGAWIMGKIIVGALALPIGFPIGYILTKRRMLRKAELLGEQNPETETVVKRRPSLIQLQATRIRQIYHTSEWVICWLVFCFATPVREWQNQGAEGARQTLILLVVWIIVELIVGMAGSKFVYRFAERALRRRAEARGEDPDAPA